MTLDRVTVICVAVAGLGAAAAALFMLAPSPEAPRIQAPERPAPPPVDADALAALAGRLAAPEEAAPDAAPAPSIALRLIGLVQSDEGRLAVLTDGARTYTVRAGDVVRGYTVLGLDGDGVRLQTPDGDITLRLAER